MGNGAAATLQNQTYWRRRVADIPVRLPDTGGGAPVGATRRSCRIGISIDFIGPSGRRHADSRLHRLGSTEMKQTLCQTRATRAHAAGPAPAPATVSPIHDAGPRAAAKQDKQHAGFGL